MEKGKKRLPGWDYVDSMLDKANEMGFSPAEMQLVAAKWAGEGGRKPKPGSLGLSVSETPIKYDSIESELSAFRDTVSKILKSKNFKLDDFKDKGGEELFDAIQYRPKGKVAGKDYYMFNNVRGDEEYKKLITGTPEYRYFNKEYIDSKYRKNREPDMIEQINSALRGFSVKPATTSIVDPISKILMKGVQQN